MKTLQIKTFKILRSIYILVPNKKNKEIELILIFLGRISSGDIEITEELSDNRRVTLMNNFNDTPPISPVSTSPYIPIFECITGKSPVFDPKVCFKDTINCRKTQLVSQNLKFLNSSPVFM